MAYRHLLAPLRVGNVTLRNRSIMGSMHTGMEDKASDFVEMSAYFAERARGQVGLIVTGGIAPNIEGSVLPFAGRLSMRHHVARHRLVTQAVHKEGGLIAMQILHAGRYGYHPLCVAPSRIKSPISPFSPWPLPGWGVEKQIRDYVSCAKLAQDAGYDGVEIMGSEGYLISEFLATKTNTRTDRWGGAFENRMQFPLEIVRRTREAVGKDFLIIFRLSLLDLVEKGLVWDEVETLAVGLQSAGVSIINSGVGWHESRIPTIATSVPRGAFVWTTAKLKASGKLTVPVCATNRINTPELAESILAEGKADLVSMARPFLADAEFMRKAAEGRRDLINICIACNQACLDHTFSQKRASCLVNPRACMETQLNYTPTAQPKRVAVVGAGPAGLACATVAAQRGHTVTLFEASDRIGGQFNLAQVVPGKEEFSETLRYYERLSKETGRVELLLNRRATVDDLAGFDEVVVATGVAPRMPDVEGLLTCGIAHPYDRILSGAVVAGNRVAIMGAGGIGFDVATFLAHRRAKVEPETIEHFNNKWGIDGGARGGVKQSAFAPAERTIYLLQRKNEKLGSRLGKTTGWIHRTSLTKEGIIMMAGVAYKRATAQGLVVSEEGKEGEWLLEVDTIVICTGQNPMRDIFDGLKAKNVSVQLIGGAHEAKELDAKHAIRQGSIVGSKL